MKTAISIPDSLYQSAEALIAQLGTNRSKLYTQAVEDYVAKYRQSDTTRLLNEIYSEQESRLDEALYAMQIRSLPKEEW